MRQTGCMLLAALLVAAGAAPAALAQTTVPPKPGSKEVIPEKQAPPLETGRSDSLSNKLNKSNGVIQPNANVDPGMAVPAPAVPHTTPVIPPSATGGNSAK